MVQNNLLEFNNQAKKRDNNLTQNPTKKKTCQKALIQL